MAHPWAIRRGVWLIGLAGLVPIPVGSAFNIWYNLIHIKPLLTEGQYGTFLDIITVYNVVVYPALIAVWIGVLASVRRPFVKGLPPSDPAWTRSRRRVINLPWWGMSLSGVGWLLCIPVFLGFLSRLAGPLDGRLYIHLPVSILIAALISTTHAFFILELLGLRILYPAFFGEVRPYDTPGTYPLSIRSRGLLWAVSAGVCPIASLLLLIFSPDTKPAAFAASVGGLGIGFGLVTAWLVGQLVTEPVDALRGAAQSVAAGQLDVRVDLLRADEFGPLITDFNHMVGELAEKRRLSETFGRHVGQHTARMILDRDPQLGGVEEVATVCFVDIRDFTARCAECTPAQVVSLLNLFFTEMVEVVEERNGGMVNKYLGDGFMALFGTFTGRTDHADAGVAAGREMLDRLKHVNTQLAEGGVPPLEIGIGLHTGRCVVGSIGSPLRQEYTAIGSAVNLASRVESLTKVVGRPMLASAATVEALESPIDTEALPPQAVKGSAEPLDIFAVR